MVQQFKTGYYKIHPDVSLNYQMNRFSDGSEEMVQEMKAVAHLIHDYADYIKQFLVLSEKAFLNGELLHAAMYLRSAEFFMFQKDERKNKSRLQFIDWMKECYQVQDSCHYNIPFENSAMHAYRFTPESPSGTILLFGGFDSYIEELFGSQQYLFQNGFDVITFDGPGQGTTLEEHHLSMTHEWHKPCKAVLDYFNLTDVTIIGYSLGGCLAVRAAAYEPRISRVVCDDILTDFYNVALKQLSAAEQTVILTLCKAGAAAVVNAMLNMAMKKSLVADWGITQGMHVTGTTTPYDFLQKTRMLETHSVSALVEQDVLLFAGSEDHYIPLHQFYDQIQSLYNVQSLTARLFTAKEQAQNHVQVGNMELSLQTIIEWITTMQNRNSQMQHLPYAASELIKNML